LPHPVRTGRYDRLVLKTVRDMMDVSFVMYDDIWATAKNLH